eukprot:GHVS01050750.1.p1 GENE.GHVS01050750.1~~GHVS01050750.1.p1  ORF type:complete len:454 (+),score=97.65 GHVS01050750.1:113-1474(+)
MSSPPPSSPSSPTSSACSSSSPSNDVSFTDGDFKSLGLCPELVLACSSLQWSHPTPIQTAVLPHALLGHDIVGLAETGSGKTAAFALPILQALLDKPQRMFALVLAPTRELCIQIAETFAALGSGIAVEVATVVGGLDMVAQAVALGKKPHVVVGSPGRLVDHLENTKGVTLRTLKYLVLDEADRLLSMDFEVALDKIVQVAPTDRTTYLFSATMTSKVSKLQRASLRKPVKVEVSSRYGTVSSLVQHYLLVPMKLKWTYLTSILHHFLSCTVMIFSNTCVTARRAAVFLRHLGFNSVCLHGKMTQPQRLAALNQFKAGERRVLVATEVGSRGLDIPSVDMVLNLDIPASAKDYIHRVGRTARAGRSGRALTIVTQYDVESLQKVEKALGKQLEEFDRLEENVVMSFHERSLEALRTADSEVKETDEELQMKKKKFSGARPAAPVKKKARHRG